MRKLILVPAILATLSLPFAVLAADKMASDSKPAARAAAVSEAKPAAATAVKDTAASTRLAQKSVAHKSKKAGGVCLTCSASKKKQG